MELYENDVAGQMVRRIRPDCTGATYTYNQRRKLTRIQWDQNKAEPSTFTYDLAGRMTQAKNLSATVDRQYDAKGQLKTETQTITAPENTNPFSVAYAHNADGKLHSLTYPDGTVITYLYNARGELDEVTDSSSSLSAPGSTLPRPLARYERRADGTIAKLTLANGLTTTRSYDEAGRLTEIKHTSATGEVLESEASRYDARDRRTARIRGDGTADLFNYDPAGQVIAAAYGQASTVAITAPCDEPKSPDSPNSAITEKEGFTPTQTFACDAAGNRMKNIDQGQSTEYTANENNQYTTIAENGQQHEPDYDKSGNLLHDATRKFTWDADIHLLSVTTTSSEAQAPGSQPPSTIVNNSKQSSTASFRYDPLHRRVSRTESSSQTTTYFIHDGWNVIAEYSVPLPDNRSTKAQQLLNKAQPALAARHIWGEDLSRTLQGAGGIGGLLSSTHNISSTTNEERGTKNLSLFFSYDSNGNVTLLTDAQCLTAAKYKYDAFGQTITATGSAANLNRYRFSTKPVELASGLAFYGYRYYDPLTGRWLSMDPLCDYHFSKSFIHERPLLTQRLGKGGDSFAISIGASPGAYLPAENNLVSQTDFMGLIICGTLGVGFLEAIVESVVDQNCQASGSGPLGLAKCHSCCHARWERDKFYAAAGFICDLIEMGVEVGAVAVGTGGNPAAVVYAAMVLYVVNAGVFAFNLHEADQDYQQCILACVAACPISPLP